VKLLFRLEDTASVVGELERGASDIREFHLGARVMGELDDISKEVSMLLLFVMEQELGIEAGAGDRSRR
jgi:hypothetical protein